MNARKLTPGRMVPLLLLLVMVLASGSPGAAWSGTGLASGGSGGGGGDDGGGGDGGGGGGGGGESTLKLRLNDAVGQPGGTVAFVVRTYAARPLRQGRITVRVRKPAAKAAQSLGIAVGDVVQPARPLTFLRAIVFSANNDATSTSHAVNGPDSQSVGMDFRSPTSSVNAADGPLAVIFMKVDRGVAPGSVYTVEIDPAETGLTDAAGAPLAITPISARLRIRAPKAAFELEAEGDQLAPGELAEMGVETFEPFAVFGGRITLRWDPAAQDGVPQVRMDPRYGKATFKIVSSTPGLLVVDFQSPSGALNSVPGRILGVSLPTRAGAPIGWSSPVFVDAAQSWLYAKRNRRHPVRFEAGSLGFE